MDSPLRTLRCWHGALSHVMVGGLLAAIVFPALMGAVWLALLPALDLSPWQALWQDPRTLNALVYTLWTAIVSSVLAWLTAGYLLRSVFLRPFAGRWLNSLPALLATPHAAMAIALALWIAPTGWLFRLTSPWLTGFDSPPPWPTTQDPFGIGLIVTLWIKEVPFLCWVAATQLQREDVRRRWQSEWAVAQTMGHTPSAAFAQVVWPQLSWLLRWPLMAVLAYSMTVVDVALIIGPASPPTLAVLAWEWLRDADALYQQQGVAAAWFLALMLFVIGCALWHAVGWLKPSWEGRYTRHFGWRLLGVVYGMAWLALFIGSFTGVWPFPEWLPQHWQLSDWIRVLVSSGSLGTTLGLALLSATTTLVWVVAWLEFAPRRWHQVLRPLLLAPMILPPLLWVFGLYRVALWGHWEGAWFGMVVAHAVMALPYVILALESVYRASDSRLEAIAMTLGRHRLEFLLEIKWPLLKRALWSAWAIAFAVSVAQYLPTLFVGAGRFVTVTTEAVAQATAGQRSLMSAYALLQTVLPLAVFALAALLGRPRVFHKGLV